MRKINKASVLRSLQVEQLSGGTAIRDTLEVPPVDIDGGQ